MILSNIIKRATDFGTFRSRDNYFSFILKIVFYIIPAVIMGNYTDILLKNYKQIKYLEILYFIIFYYRH